MNQKLFDTCAQQFKAEMQKFVLLKWVDGMND